MGTECEWIHLSWCLWFVVREDVYNVYYRVVGVMGAEDELVALNRVRFCNLAKLRRIVICEVSVPTTRSEGSAVGRQSSFIYNDDKSRVTKIKTFQQYGCEYE